MHRITYVGSKILADQLIFASFYTGFFYYGVGLIGGKTTDQCWDDVRHKFVPTYATDCAVWPLLQMFNFTLVPQHLRVLYVNVCNVAWNSFLSVMANAHHHHAYNNAPSMQYAAIVKQQQQQLAQLKEAVAEQEKLLALYPQLEKMQASQEEDKKVKKS